MGAISTSQAMAGRPLRGALTADVRNFGATEDDAGPAVREILETFAPGDPIRVWFPTGKWLFREPIIVGRNRVEFCGESPVATTLAMADYGPGLWAYKREALWTAPRVDAYGLLDLTACPGPGQRWGLAVGGKSWHVVPAFPPTTGRGDGWAELPGLALSIGFAAAPADGPILGLGDRQEPMPIFLDCYYEPGLGRRVFRLAMTTADRPRAPREFLCGDAGTPGQPGPLRLDLQIGFDRGGADGLAEVLAWQDRRTTPVLRSWGMRNAVATADEPAFAPANRVRFARNRLANFKLGNGSFADHTTQGKDGSYTTFGLSLACDAPFRSDGAGNQVRADGGGPVDDSYRYLHAGRSAEDLIARMSLDRSDGIGSPIVRWNSGASTGSVAGMGFSVGAGANPVEALTVRDLAVQLLGHGGSAILLGPVLGVLLDRVTGRGGAHGLAGLNCGASYDLTGRGCSFGGTDTWVKLTDTIVDLDGLTRDYVPGSALVLSGCNARIGPIRTGDVTGGRPVIDLAGYNAYDSQYELEHLSVDQEMGAACVGVRCEKAPVGTRLVLGTIGAGLRDGVTPVVDLVDRAPQGPRGNAPGRCVVRGPIVGEPDIRAEGDWTVERS